jgi:hypothetical protein
VHCLPADPLLGHLQARNVLQASLYFGNTCTDGRLPAAHCQRTADATFPSMYIHVYGRLHAMEEGSLACGVLQMNPRHISRQCTSVSWKTTAKSSFPDCSVSEVRTVDLITNKPDPSIIKCISSPSNALNPHVFQLRNRTIASSESPPLKATEEEGKVHTMLPARRRQVRRGVLPTYP